jgi:hypothetical protein
MAKKLQPIDYTSRDFDSIRRDLESYAKRYYPDTYKDFNKSSFGSLMLDTVAYVGDILSFYLDYQTNESFLETALEYNNVIRLARQMGFKLNTSPSSYGLLTCYIQVPASTLIGGPDMAYAPVLRAGSTFSSTGGGMYTLLEDIDFSQTTNQLAAGDVVGVSPVNYIIRAQGRAVSGRLQFKEVEVDEFQRFLQIPLDTSNVTEVISVVDSEGHTYYEVDHLSQNIIYKAIRNTNTATNGSVRNILKATPVARRFTVERGTDGQTFIQFGYGSDSELLSESVVDPSSVILELNGRNYITARDFDPTRLISTDKFGIAPANTTLRIGYRVNTVADVNAAVGTIVNSNNPQFRFTAQGSLSLSTRNNVVNSLEITNEEPFVGDISLPSSDEIKQRVFGYYAAQSRAVTAQDYETIAYAMPPEFGSVKRATVVRDFDEFRRNLNIYVISQNSSGKLVVPNSTLKNNLRSWLLQYKVINDTIDILNASIVNFGINYTVAIDLGANRFSVISRANAALSNFLLRHQYDIGESIRITDFYKVLQKIDGVIDVTDIEIVGRTGVGYADASFDFQDRLSADGRMIDADSNSVFELKFPNVDIKGSIQ